MSRYLCGVVACLLLVSKGAFAQEWSEYRNTVDRFTVSAPGEPTAEPLKWNSEYGAVFPATVYRWQQGPNRYSVTVVDYTESEAIHAKVEHSPSFQAPVYWQIDVMGSMDYAAARYRQRPGVTVTWDAFHYINFVTGHELQLTNADQSRTYLGIYLHENRLYILDATVAKGQAPPIIFQQSMEFLDAEGKSIRYRAFYFNRLPQPKLKGSGPIAVTSP